MKAIAAAATAEEIGKVSWQLKLDVQLTKINKRSEREQ